MSSIYSIGEFSKITGLSAKTLRFYHERGLLIPSAIDPATAYRHYDQQNLEKARIIVLLREVEFTLDEIAEMLSGATDDEDLLAYFERKKSQISKEIRSKRAITRQLEQVITMERNNQQAATQIDATVSEKLIEPILVAGIRMKGRYSDSGSTFGQLARKLGRHIAGKAMCLYYDGEYREEDADFEPCFPIAKPLREDGFKIQELPQVRCVSILHQGPYSSLGRSYQKLIDTIHHRNAAAALPSREVYLKGPGMIFKGNPKKYLTEILIPITG